ncbi:MAG: aldolase/citrate lyase family protein [Hespellia sp.]|nr:aldolase/citrate lyase family protein [Hespellia sp.]
MKMAELKNKLKNGERIIGTMVTTFQNPDIARILQVAGYDFFIIDCEHGCFEYGEVARIINVARGIGIPAIVRIAEIRRELVLKFVEMGANGLLLPNTETKEQAELLVKYSKYAPLGDRGVSLSRPHTGYQKVNGKEYMEQANKDTILLCQIESKKGVNHVEDIIAVEGIDIAFVGPNDMSQDYGILGQFNSETMETALQKIVNAAQAAGKYAGVHFGGKEQTVKWINRGYQMNMCGSDVSLMIAGAKVDQTYIVENTEVQ